MTTSQYDTILVVDFGSQYTQLIARRVRQQGVYSEIVPYHRAPEVLDRLTPRGLILSGGPASTYDEGAPQLDPALLEVGVPVLGICYGMQALARQLGGLVSRSERREYGSTLLEVDDDSDLLQSVAEDERGLTVWMSHGDKIDRLPEGFILLAHTANTPYAAIADRSRRLYGLQFHPEVAHTPKGQAILDNFIFTICGCRPDWTMGAFVERTVEEVRQRVGKGSLICGLSGGVDSTVVAVLLHRAIGGQLRCVFVDNGLLRAGEADEVMRVLRSHFHMEICRIDASEQFLTQLKGVTDPEQKRKIIGAEFIAVFEAAARDMGREDFLAQGTLYPDVIESVSPFGGPSRTIKSHHNVGGLPEKMGLTLIEPLRELFKDEVRLVGLELGIPEEIIWRHPFPGPGLAVRILGEVTPERLETVRAADAIVVEEVRRAGWYRRMWQAFAVLLPVKSVGVMGDERTFENVVAVRAVESVDGMTADWAPLPADLLRTISNRIINEVPGVNRVVYDISSKPPSTIEWE